MSELAPVPFAEKIGLAWLEASAFALGAAASRPMGNDRERAQWRLRRDRCLKQGNLVLDLAAEDTNDPIARAA